MKILHVAESIQGGCGTYLNEMLPAQIREFGAENVCVVAPSQHADILTDVPTSCVVRFDRPGRRAGLSRLATRSYRQIRKFRPDVIHAHSTFAGAIVRPMRLLMSGMAPVVYCPHGWVFEVESSRIVRSASQLLERLLSHSTHKIIAISQHEYDLGIAIGIHPERLKVVENGIHPDIPVATPADWEDSRLKVLFVGRLDRQKGIDVLTSAVGTYLDRISVRVVGTSVAQAEKGLTVPPNVALLGWRNRDEIASLMTICDLVVMPSRWEGFGLVAIEAMRAARPVVASAVGGLRSVVVDGVTGLLVPKEDPDALAAAILSRDAEGWAEMGRAGQERFLARYTSERTHAELVEIYRSCLSETDRQSAKGKGTE